MNRGVACALGAYLTWGLFPIYWKALHQVPAFELICHRIVWSCVTLFVMIAARRRWERLAGALRRPRTVAVYVAAALLIGVNWFIFVWGVNAGFVIEVSLGYFINPLLSVLLGVALFRERLRSWQWAALLLAAAAVLYLGFAYGAVPWIALALALSFGLYGAVKKIAPLGALDGLMLETGLLFLPAFAFLAWGERAGGSGFLHRGGITLLLLLGSGIVTSLPLLLFAAAARRIPLAQVGVLQYITPSLQFLLGVLLYHEKFTAAQFAGFVMIWAALAVFGIEGILHASIRARSVPEEP